MSDAPPDKMHEQSISYDSFEGLIVDVGVRVVVDGVFVVYFLQHSARNLFDKQQSKWMNEWKKYKKAKA